MKAFYLKTIFSIIITTVLNSCYNPFHKEHARVVARRLSKPDKWYVKKMFVQIVDNNNVSYWDSTIYNFGTFSFDYVDYLNDGPFLLCEMNNNFSTVLNEKLEIDLEGHTKNEVSFQIRPYNNPNYIYNSYYSGLVIKQEKNEMTIIGSPRNWNYLNEKHLLVPFIKPITSILENRVKIDYFLSTNE